MLNRLIETPTLHPDWFLSIFKPSLSYVLESDQHEHFNNILTFNTYIALICMHFKRFTSIVLQYDLEI